MNIFIYLFICLLSHFFYHWFVYFFFHWFIKFSICFHLPLHIFFAHIPSFFLTHQSHHALPWIVPIFLRRRSVYFRWGIGSMLHLVLVDTSSCCRCAALFCDRMGFDMMWFDMLKYRLASLFDLLSFLLHSCAKWLSFNLASSVLSLPLPFLPSLIPSHVFSSPSISLSLSLYVGHLHSLPPSCTSLLTTSPHSNLLSSISQSLCGSPPLITTLLYLPSHIISFPPQPLSPTFQSLCGSHPSLKWTALSPFLPA